MEALHFLGFQGGIIWRADKTLGYCFGENYQQLCCTVKLELQSNSCVADADFQRNSIAVPETCPLLQN